MTITEFKSQLNALIPASIGTIEDIADDTVRIVPQRSDSAEIVIRFRQEGSKASAVIGEDTAIDVAENRCSYSSRAGLDELLLIVKEVVEHGFSETLLTQGARLVRSEALIVIEGRQRTLVHTTIWKLPFLRTTARRIVYAPYGGTV